MSFLLVESSTKKRQWLSLCACIGPSFSLCYLVINLVILLLITPNDQMTFHVSPYLPTWYLFGQDHSWDQRSKFTLKKAYPDCNCVIHHAIKITSQIYTIKRWCVAGFICLLNSKIKGILKGPRLYVAKPLFPLYRVHLEVLNNVPQMTTTIRWRVACITRLFITMIKVTPKVKNEHHAAVIEVQHYWQWAWHFAERILF